MEGLRRYTWWTVPGTLGVVVVLFGGRWLLQPGVGAGLRIVCAVALAVTAAAAVVLLTRRVTGRAGAQRTTTAWLIAGGVAAAGLGVAVLAARQYAVWVVAPATMVSVAATYAEARRRRVLLLAAAGVAPLPGLAVSLASGGEALLYAALFPLGVVVFTAWTTLGPLWAWDVAGRLDHARLVAAELAVQEERLRFAADLHDIQGHHLQVIAVKSELAARLALRDPQRAAGEMREVQQIAADALRETRGLVQGYRRTTLQEEIANATRVLAAADVDARMDVAPGAERLPDRGRHLFGLVVREATTNVLRHSAAARAEVVYRADDRWAYLSVENDGAHGEPRGDGGGLTGLAARIVAAGGELTWRRDGGRFTVAATLPLAEETA
ncbi:MAG: histidine kinase [Hamadaea sp.]|nr:histidine kinase [Hamadaea sp.]